MSDIFMSYVSKYEVVIYENKVIVMYLLNDVLSYLKQYTPLINLLDYYFFGIFY